MTSISLSPEEVRSIEPRFDHLEESPIDGVGGLPPIGWHVNAMDGSRACLGSGLSEDKDTARRIALAETIERASFRELRASKEASQYGLIENPTTCGFAAGFEFEKTRIRSICEAVERWARALWIDEHFALMPVPDSRIFLSTLGKTFIEPFQQCLYFTGSFSVIDPAKRSPIHLKLAVVIGLTSQGAFPGSRVCSEKEDPWEHASLEAWRHHLLFKHQSLQNLPEKSYLHRINYFGSHRNEALSQVEKASRYDWPMPKISLHRSYEPLAGKLFIWRSLCSNYQGWQTGGIDRFVY